LAQFSISYYLIIHYVLFTLNNISNTVVLNNIGIIILFLTPWAVSTLFKLSKKEIFIFLILSILNDIITDNIVSKNKNFSVYLLITYLFILISNLLGMIPFSITTTSFIIISFFFSLTTFAGLNTIGMFYNKGGIWKLFLPEGIPTAISIFLIVIEIISYIARVFSLSIRLFANMMSGHSLLKILISFAWVSVWLNFSVAPVSILPIAVVFATIGLEFVIAFLQAYVYMILASIYLNDVINLH
jgi:ATP synthase subunit 6